jgi:hypothetical protein
MSKLGRFLFWDYPRASVPYDIMVGLILAFVFFTPREFFHDQPKAASVVMLPADESGGLFWIEPELLAGVPENERVSKAASLVNSRFKTRKYVSRVETILDSEQEIKGYMAFTQP